MRRRPRARVAAAGAAVALAALGHVVFGHAGAEKARLLTIAAQWVHVVTVGAWIGGLLALLVAIRGASPDARGAAVRRFSALALPFVVVVAATGTLRAFQEIGAWSRVTSTSFGQAVLVKSGLLLVLVALGALNRYRTVPVAADAPRGLQRAGRVELAIAAVVLATTGILSGVAPPRSAAESTARADRLVASGADFGTTVRVRLTVTPGGPGPNAFEARVLDYDSRAPVRADAVSLRFAYGFGGQIEPSTLPLRAGAPGVFAARGSDLSLPGPWTVTATVRRGADAVTIPLVVFTRVEQQVSTIPAPSGPTLYNVALQQGSVQMYVDPGKGGSNEVHATYFDAKGEELPARGAIIVASLRGGPLRTLAVRRLSAGHFVADATLEPGPWRFDALALTSAGDPMTAFFEQAIRT